MKIKVYLLTLVCLLFAANTSVKADESLPFKTTTNLAEATWYKITSFSGYVVGLNDNLSLSLTSASSEVTDDLQWCFVGDNDTNGFTIYNKSNTNLIVGLNGEIPTLKADDGTRWYMRELNNATKGVMYAISLFEYRDNASAYKNWNNHGGSGQSVQFWAGGASNNHSLWTFEKYVPKEFLPVTINKDNSWYRIKAYSGYYAIAKEDGSLGFSTKEENDYQLWSFRGDRNDTGLTVYNKGLEGKTLDVSNDIPVFTEDNNTKWYLRKVENADNGTMYSICPIEYKDNATANKHWNNKGQTNTEIQLYAGANSNKHSHWWFEEYRSPYNSKLQVYRLPCGSRISGNAAFLRSATIEGEAVVEPLMYETEIAPSSYYLLHTNTKPIVERGKSFELVLTGNQDDTKKDFSATNAYIYCDWDRDGTFEYALPVHTEALNIRQAITVPEDTDLGKMRIRVRYTEKDITLSGAEDDVWGMTYDFVFKVVEPKNEGRIVTVASNENKRGTVELIGETNSNGNFDYGTSVTVKATIKGNSTFRYWKQGNIIVSTNEEYTFDVKHDTNLIAYFTPNTTSEAGIKNIENLSYRFLETNGTLSFYFEEDAVLMEVYSLSGGLMLKSFNNQVSTRSLPTDTYIVTAYTANHIISTKTILNYNK
ncbi:hypothetical protein M2138_000358 [Dysgonomonadaceae bacterium PH5-43]|nr:hypothetical protein [Dysgonomonadaceae bacterium PH5-43]